jgi:hypothetical protein
MLIVMVWRLTTFARLVFAGLYHVRSSGAIFSKTHIHQLWTAFEIILILFYFFCGFLPPIHVLSTTAASR